MSPISVCMIMKNESRHLARCLDSFQSYGFELILVDTGSSDSTVDIASRYTDKVHHFDWIDDFSAARNYAVSLASHDWVLILDCDEYISSLNVDSLLQFTRDCPQSIGLITIHNLYTLNGGDSFYSSHLERFFNRKHYHYVGKVHEQVSPLDGRKPSARPLDLEVIHTGYSGTPEELREKALRNIHLLETMLLKDSSDPYLYFQLGQCYNMIHEDEKAAHYYSLGLTFDLDPELEYVQMMVIGYGYALLHLERYEEALELKEVHDHFSSSADFLCLMGLIYLRTGSLVSAMAEFLMAISCPVAHTKGANSFIPYYNMGCINELLGDKKTALTLYRKCGDFPMALSKIQELEST